MTKPFLSNMIVVGLLALAVAGGARAAEGAGGLESAHTNVGDQASLQRGAKLFMNYCSGCHSLKYLRYSRLADDLGLSEEQVMTNLNMTNEKFHEPIVSAMPEADATNWFGNAPPDLSLEVRAKGADWVYTYLKSFYVDPSQPMGWNNTVFPGVGMPNVLAPLQGIQKAVHAGDDPDSEIEKLELVEPGKMAPAQFDEAVRDLTAFMQYASEPAALKRVSMGYWVLLYLALFTLVAYLLKRAFWKDVH